MKNLKWLIPKAGLDNFEFAKLVFEKAVNDKPNNKDILEAKVRRFINGKVASYKKVEIKRMIKVLNTDYNTLLEDE